MVECQHCFKPVEPEDESQCPFCGEEMHDDCNMDHQNSCNES